MLLVLFFLYLFFFLFTGAMAFVLAVTVPNLKKFALSTALWFAVWGPCTLAALLLAGLAVIAQSFAQSPRDRHSLSTLPHILGWTFTILALLGTAAIATFVAALHQFLIHRMTFSLFRIYAALVSAGIGSVLGWALNLWMLDSLLPHFRFLWIIAMILLITGFGYLAFRYARHLRGPAPTRFTWLTSNEFDPGRYPPGTAPLNPPTT